jgi:tape measure domain-containing protein
MEQVGVQAVVQGLAAFMSDMRQVNSAIDGLRPSSTLLQRTFESLGEAVLGFGAHILRVAEVTIGVLLRDAINFIVGKIREMIDAVIEAGAEFQILQLRLERLNLNTLLESGMEFNEAMEESIRLTKEQLEWIQKLAASSPYDAQDVANTFTLARSYGFAAEDAERLTENILDFAAGMGLGNTEMERIIINFGQLVQQGKLNGQELRDLARGAFVPVNDILERMAKNMGITVDELNDMREAGTDGNRLVTEFMTGFNELVEERFVGASEKMSRTVKGAVDNFKDLFKSIIGFGVVKPLREAKPRGIA